MPREILGRVGLIVLALVISLVIGEIAVRALGAAPDVVLIQRGRFRLSRNVKIGYEPVPGLNYQGESLEFFDYRGVSNSLGYRDYEHSVRKPEGTYRILILGDSVGAGLKVEDYRDTFPAVLEALLKVQGLKVEVINLSVSGYNTQQEVETLREKGLAYDPDLVLLAYCLNDRVLDDGYILGTLLEQQLASKDVPVARSQPLLTKSAVYRLLRYRVFETGRPEVPEDLRVYYQQVAKDTVEEYVTELARLADLHDFAALLVVFPYFEDFAQYRFEGQHRWVARMARSRGLHYLDLLPAFRTCEQQGGDRVSFDLYHPTPRGHRCAAQAMARHIMATIIPKG